MRSRVVVGVVAVIGICALFAPPARAGGAAGAALLETFFECQSITGAHVGEVVSTHNFDDSVSHADLLVGNPVFKCRQVNVSRAGILLVPPPLADELKCYIVTEKAARGPAEALVLEDAFFAQDPVRASRTIQLLCGPTVPSLGP